MQIEMSSPNKGLKQLLLCWLQWLFESLMTERDRHFEGRDLVENTQMSPDAVADNTSLYGGGGRERVVTPPPLPQTTIKHQIWFSLVLSKIQCCGNSMTVSRIELLRDEQCAECAVIGFEKELWHNDRLCFPDKILAYISFNSFSLL